MSVEMSTVANGAPGLHAAPIKDEGKNGPEKPDRPHAIHEGRTDNLQISGYTLGGMHFSTIIDAMHWFFSLSAENFEKYGALKVGLLADVNDKIDRSTEWMKKLKEDKDNHASPREQKELENLLKELGKWDKKMESAIYKAGDAIISGVEAKKINAALDGFVSSAQSLATLIMTRIQSAKKTQDAFLNADSAAAKTDGDLRLDISRRY